MNISLSMTLCGWGYLKGHNILIRFPAQIPLLAIACNNGRKEDWVGMNNWKQKNKKYTISTLSS